MVMHTLHIGEPENTRLENADFPFKCFYIGNSNTLPHWHHHTELIYVQHGQCFIYVNGTLFTCHKGDILFIPREGLHSVLTNSDSNYIAIVIGDTFFTSLLTDMHCNKGLFPFLFYPTLDPLHIATSHPAYSELSSFITSVIEEEKTKINYYELMIKAKLCEFFALLHRAFPQQLSLQATPYNPRVEIIKKAIEYLSVHYNQKITLTDISRYANLSNQHFARLFKEYTGKTFVEFLTIYRLKQAHLLLTTTNIPITQIPEKTGFCNSNYFARVYKYWYGYAPSYARKK
jgi:AraC-like DNA-binding protein